MAPAVILIPTEGFIAVDLLILWGNTKIQHPLRGKMSNLPNQLFTVLPTAALLERIFTSFGLVQSKLRSRH